MVFFVDSSFSDLIEVFFYNKFFSFYDKKNLLNINESLRNNQFSYSAFYISSNHGPGLSYNFSLFSPPFISYGNFLISIILLKSFDPEPLIIYILARVSLLIINLITFQTPKNTIGVLIIYILCKTSG